VVLPELHDLVARHHLQPEPISRLEQVLDLLTAYGYQTEEIELNLGLGRGLHYYTGILFEIYAEGSPSLQLCGGGRYDDLAQVLGARQALPACGFSYGLERVVDAAGWTIEPEPVQVLVAAEHAGASAAAIRVSERLRAEGFSVEVDVRGRSVEANRRYARRRGITRLVVVRGADEIDQYDLHPGLVTAGGGPENIEEPVRG
jgi:histidyl-tRNA synthetase